MAAPFTHAHVLHLTKKGRRRSQSVTLSRPESTVADSLGHSMRRKQFWDQLQMEREHHRDNTQKSGERYEEDREEGHRQPTVTRIAGSGRTISRKKHKSSAAATPVLLKKQVSTAESKTTDEEDDEHHPHVTRIPRADSAKSSKKQDPSAMYKISNVNLFTTCQESNVNVFGTCKDSNPYSSGTGKGTNPYSFETGKDSNPDSSETGKGSNPDSSEIGKGLFFDGSQLSSNPYNTSSTHLMTKSAIFDQEFNLNDSKDQARKKDTKGHGTIRISEREKSYAVNNKRLPSRSSASFMGAIIATIIAVIAFAFGLTALILVLLLRSTVMANFAAYSASLNSSSSASGSSGTIPYACSAYTTVNDPTRGVSAVGYPLGCDNTAPFQNQSSSIWVRFMGSGGTTLPLTTPGMNICGTESTGWYDGTMPSSTGTILNGTACFSWYSSVCRYSVSISVANCGSFYIYLLPPPPVCMARYCTI